MNKLAAGLLLLTGILTIVTGCSREQIQGKGSAKQEVREVSEFTGINIDGNYSILGSIKPTQKFVISSNENILPYIISTVKSGVLMVENKKSVDVQPTVTQNIWVDGPRFDSLTLNGTSQFKLLDIATDKFSITLSGSHRTLFSGKATEINITINGSSDVDAKDLSVENANIEINGSSTVLINATKNLNVKISGNGKVVYYSPDVKVEQSINGSGQVVSAFGGINKQNTQ